MVGRWSILLPATIVAGCAGLAAGMQPLLTLLVVTVLIVAAVAVVDITFAVAAFSALAVAYFGEAPNRAFAAGLFVALAWWIATTDRSGQRSLLAAQPGFTLLVLGFLAWMTLSLAWSPNTGVALQTLGRYALVLFFFPAVFAAVQTRRQARIVIGAVVMAAAAGAVIAAVSGTQSGQRLAGLGVDPNTFAAVLLPAAVLGAALAMRPVGLSRTWRGALRVAAVLALGGIFASESRGAIIAMIVVLVALPLTAGRWRGKALVLSLSALALVGGSVAIPGSPVVKAFQGRGLGTSGRNDLWTIAWRMIEAHPVGGVGVGNFKQTSADYLLRPGAFSHSNYIVDTPAVAHNSYLQVGAEMGLIGLLLFVGIIAWSVTSAWRAARRFERARDPGSELIARALVLAMLAMLTAVLFLTYTDYGRPMWILLALGPALLGVSRSLPRRPNSQPHLDQPVRPMSRRAVRPHSIARDVPARL